MRYWSVAVAILLGVQAASAAAYTFPDIAPAQEHATAISTLYEQGIIHGYPDGTFHPDATISRAEFLKMIYALDGTGDVSCAQSTVFPDVSEGSWYATPACWAKQEGLIQGYSDGMFRPSQEISVAEAAKILVQQKDLNVSTDSIWYRPYMHVLASLDVLSPGTDAGTKLTRAEAAEMLYRLQVQTTGVTLSTDTNSHTFASSPADSVPGDVSVPYPDNSSGHGSVSPQTSYDGSTCPAPTPPPGTHVCGQTNSYPCAGYLYCKDTSGSCPVDPPHPIQGPGCTFIYETDAKGCSVFAGNRCGFEKSSSSSSSPSLPVVTYPYTQSVALGNGGDAVGYFFRTNQLFRRSPSGTITLFTPPSGRRISGIPSSTTMINDNGDILSSTDDLPNADHAKGTPVFVWKHTGEIIQLNLPFTDQAWMNDNGLVVGSNTGVGSTGKSSAISWDSMTGNVQYLSSIAADIQTSGATKVNASGLAIGHASYAGGTVNQTMTAFLWDTNKNAAYLPVYKRSADWHYPVTNFTDINDNGQVLGYVDLGAAETRAFVWSTSQDTLSLAGSGFDNYYTMVHTQAIDVPSGVQADHVIAQRMNANGQVIGHYFNGPTDQHDYNSEVSFLWRSDSGMTDLKKLLPSGTTFNRPIALNDQGQVIGSFTNSAKINGAYFYDPATGMHILSAPAGAKAFTPRYLNNKGQVLGDATYDLPGTTTQAGGGPLQSFLYDFRTNTYARLGDPPGTSAPTDDGYLFNYHP